MKRILIFSLAYYPKPVGGAEVAIKEITDRIDTHDIEFHMVCLRFDSTVPRIEQVGNVLVHRIGPTRPNPGPAALTEWPFRYVKHLYQLSAVWEARTLHKQYHYDGVWAMMAHSCGIPAALFKTLYPKVAYIQTLQEGDPSEYIERLMRPVWPLFRRAFTKPTIIQAISVYLEQWARRLGATCPIAVVPNGVNTTHFAQEYPVAEIDAIRTTLGKREGDTFLITTSRLVHKNAVDDVIRAIALVPETVHFVILGVGSDEVLLRTLAMEQGVADRVHFLGQVNHADMPKYLKACDIFVRPSRSEGMGNSFIEAMAAGVPVIATQEGGIADFLFDEKRNPTKPTTGWAVDKDAPQQIAQAVHDICARPDTVATVVATAREMVVARYDWNLVAHDMLEQVFSDLTIIPNE